MIYRHQVRPRDCAALQLPPWPDERSREVWASSAPTRPRPCLLTSGPPPGCGPACCQLSPMRRLPVQFVTEQSADQTIPPSCTVSKSWRSSPFKSACFCAKDAIMSFLPIYPFPSPLLARRRARIASPRALTPTRVGRHAFTRVYDFVACHVCVCVTLCR